MRNIIMASALAPTVKRAALCVAAVAALSLSGCVDPFRAHVDPAAVKREWTVTEGGEQTSGAFGPNQVDTEYKYVSTAAPFTGDLLVISVRQGGGFSTPELVDLAHRLLGAGAEANMTLDPHASQEGERLLRNGLETHWIIEQGTVTRASATGLFRQDATVRLIAEVGFDGLSSTAIVAVGQAQIAAKVQCPLIGQCPSQPPDYTTWNYIVGDPAGSVGGARDNNGLLYNLVTHG